MPSLPTVVGSLVALAGALPLARFGRRPVAAIAAALCATAAMVTLAAAFWQRGPGPLPEAAVAGRPVEVAADGYTGSASCRACHPREHSTWRASYHRSMTQRATQETVLADFSGTLECAGQKFALERRDDGFWIELADPVAAPGQGQRVRRKVVTTTGSHQMQVYWYETGYERVLGLLPFVWQVAERRWLPRASAFLLPHDDAIQHQLGDWSLICIKCHATHGRPRLDWDNTGMHGADTQVAEFGIACEACHGPGERHAAEQRNPLRRYLQHFDTATAPSIVDPSQLDHVRSTQVCGQCHGNFEYHFTRAEPRLQEWFQRGFTYRPGDDLLADRTLKSKGDEQFWSDGLIRVAGREYNALVGSGCFDRGEMSCLSCHTLHQAADDPRPQKEWADDQLRPDSGDASCLQCHPKFAADPAAHSHHAADSPGSRCMNCHMPHTTYGLLKGVRTHRVASPSVPSSLATGRPNACNQCHLDRSLGWTADALQRWYGTPVPELSREQRDVAAGVLWTLRGDAAQRALMAWSFGWAPAQQAAGTDWFAPYVAELLVDPYEAVRVIAERSLRTLPGAAQAPRDLLGAAEGRERAKAEVLAGFRPQGVARPEVLLTTTGLDQAAFDALLARRDRRPVRLFE
ncbi:MAG: C cytochrome precursor [Planctomycetes bacterium]|nr:C cytochrome precursor [Planctomycetota bacterium]